jgi:hypothetical protein
VLSNPEEAGGAGIAAALVPARAVDGAWKLRAQVTLDANTLIRLASAEQETGEWEVGALLVDGRGVKTWEMLAVSRLRVKADGASASQVDPEGEEDEEDEDAIILHQHTFEGLKPGRYELRAFVRDRAADLFRGDRAELELPAVDGPGLSGPVILRPGARHLRTSLPLRSRRNERMRWIATLETGSLPLDGTRAEVGDELEFLTLACPERPKEGQARVRRSIVPERADLSAPALVSRSLERAGDCVEIRDVLDTSGTPAARYTYRVHWEPAGAEPIESEATFDLTTRD